MNGSIDDDPLDELRRADPMPPDRLPPASLARVRARVFEDVAMMTNQDRRGRLTNVRVATGGLVAAVVVAVVVLGGPRGNPPGVTVPPTASPPIAVVPTPTTGTGSAMCVEQYSLATLANRGLAFDGMVTAIDQDEVTFHVNAPYRGISTESVTLTATGMTGTAITSAGGPTLVVGDRYLVAGEDHFAWSCGFTQLYDPAVAAQWAAAFGP